MSTQIMQRYLSNLSKQSTGEEVEHLITKVGEISL